MTVKAGRFFKNDRGVALVMVLWVTALLAVMAGAFSSTVRLEARGVSNYRAQAEAYYLAAGGVNIAVGRLLDNTSSTEAKVGHKRWVYDGRPYRFPLEGGVAEVRVFDEGGKIDINAATRAELTKALIVLEVEGAERDTIADSILDWIDPNSFHRLNGAEDDYYRELGEPYEAKDGPVETPDELLWVRGVTTEIFHGPNPAPDGREGSAGLRGIFTVYTGSVSVNINTAPREVLLTLPGIDSAMAKSIIDMRESGEIQDMSVLAGITRGLHPGVSNYVTFQSPGIYTIESRAELSSSPIARALRAVVRVGDGSYEIIYWKDTVYERRPV